MPKKPNYQQEAATLAFPCLPPTCAGGTLVFHILLSIILLLFSLGKCHLWRTHHHLSFHPADVSCCGCLCCVVTLGVPLLHWEAPDTALCPMEPGWGQLPLTRTAANWSATALKKCLLLGRAGGSGESQRTPAEIPYSWGRLAFSTRQEPLPCSNIPSLPLGEPADEISIALTLDKPSTRAWEGSRAAPWQNPWCKEGVQFPKGIPREPEDGKGLPQSWSGG